MSADKYPSTFPRHVEAIVQCRASVLVIIVKYTMIAKPKETLELPYPTIQYLIKTTMM